MMSKRFFSRLTACMAAIVVLASCEYRDIQDLGVLEKKDFILDFAHDRVDSIPMEYRVAFYPADNQTKENITMGYMLFDLLNRPSTLSLPVGTYRVTAWNHDTEHVITKGYGIRDEVVATTNHYRSRGLYDTPKVIDSLYHGQLILDYPDYMVHANVEQFILSGGEGTQRLTLHPDSMVIAMDVSVGGIRGLGSVTEARGCINNIPGTRYIAKDNVTADSAVVIFDCKVIPEEERVTAHFHLFGLEPTDFPGLEHKIILFFWLQNGRVYIPLDVTNLIRKAATGGYRVEIDIPNLDIDLRDYVTSESGYDVIVEGWDNVTIGVDL